MAEEPIKRIVVDAHLPYSISNGVLVRWVLNGQFPARYHPLTHEVLVGDSPSARMQKIGQVVNDEEFLDDTRRDLTKNQDVWYAIKTTDATGEVYYSRPQKMGSSWGKREWLIAREMTRQAKVRLIKRRAGVRGFHLRRRTSGVKCPCVDPDTGRVKDPNCPECYGTSFVGGYHPPVECYVDQHPEKVLIKLDAQQGLVSEKVSAWNTLAYPPFRPNDFWVDARNGLRYRIQENVATVAHLEGVPIFLQVQVKAENNSDPIYNFPIDQT